MRLRATTDNLELEVEDHGRGIAADARDAGSGWWPCANAPPSLGGTLEFLRPPQGGTLVRLKVPIAAAGRDCMTLRITVLLADDHTSCAEAFAACSRTIRRSKSSAKRATATKRSGSPPSSGRA